VVIDTGTDRHDVDARPSDAINLAVTTNAPIRVDSTLLDETAAHGDRLGWRDYEVANASIATGTQTIVEVQQRRFAEEHNP
jgi:bifunctional DNase/RNase